VHQACQRDIYIAKLYKRCLYKDLHRGPSGGLVWGQVNRAILPTS
jgi:hypothetical protein